MALSQSAELAKNNLKTFWTVFNPEFEKLLEARAQKLNEHYPEYVNKAMQVYTDISTRQQKRLRASFVYNTYKMYGGEKDELAIKMGMVIELIHAYLVIEDDFMDISDTRRGGPTAHVLFEQMYHQESFIRGDSIHYGNSMAVLAALTGSHIAMQIINSLDIDAQTKIRLSQNLNSKIEITAYGQMTDITNALQKVVSEKDVLNMLRWKTGVYTYENPIHSGAILAGVSDAELAKLSEYAIPGGISFQVQDDILGMFGDPDSTGKSNMDDLREGKYTLLIHKALENGSDVQKAVINKHLGNRQASEKDHEEVKEIIVETGSLDYSKNTALNLVNEAKESLVKNNKGQWETEGLEYLNGIANYMIERNA
jgi:geranylgeranyl diphosphate synthase type I